MEKTAAQRVSQRNIDVIAALIGMVAGIGVSGLNLIYSNEYLITMGPMLAIVCLGYLIFRRKLLGDSPEPADAGTTLTLAVNIIFWASFAGSVYSLSTEILHRPLIYFLLTSLSAAMIALQILYYRGKGTIWLVLFEILILSLSIRASAFWVFPTIPGADSWWHAEVVKDYVARGQIFQQLSTTGGVNHYYSMPVMHLNVAITQMVTGIGYKAAMFLGASLPLLLSTVFVFLIGRWLVNDRVGLLAMLLLSLSDYHIRWGAENIIAMSFGITLFTMILYLLMVRGSQAEVFRRVLITMLMIVLILTHTVSAFIMACFLLVAAIGSYIYKFLYRDRNQGERSMLTFTLAELFIVAMLFHAMYIYMIREGMSFFDSMTGWFYRSIMEKAEFLVTRAPSAATEWGQIGPIMNISGYLLLLLWGIIGCLLWLSWKHHSKTKVGLIAAIVVMIGLPLSFPVFGISNIEPTRWPAFYYVILSIPAAVSILTITNRIRYQALRGFVSASIIFGFSFLMITNSVSNADSPVYAAYLNERLVYTESEMAVAQWVISTYDGKIITDSRYGGTVMYREGGKRVYLKGTKNLSREMLNEEELNSGLVIWREALTERPAKVDIRQGGEIIVKLTVLGEGFEQKLETSHNLIYSNNRSKAFLATGIGEYR